MSNATNNLTTALSVRVPTELNELARQISAREGLQLSSFIRMAVIREIRRQQTEVASV